MLSVKYNDSTNPESKLLTWRPRGEILANKTVKVPLPGTQTMVDAVEVPVEEATERWTEIRLADGSQIRIKTVILAVVRVVDQYDNEGNPMYSLKANQIMTVSAPEHLKKGAGGSTAH